MMMAVPGVPGSKASWDEGILKIKICDSREAKFTKEEKIDRKKAAELAVKAEKKLAREKELEEKKKAREKQMAERKLEMKENEALGISG